MPEKIQDKICRYYSFINPYKEGEAGTRYKSWEWCHKAFVKKKKLYDNATSREKNNIIDELSLELAFYLASWGMYRGSSYLLQRDYKVHKRAVKAILDADHRLLWNYKPKENNIVKAHDMLFNPNQGVYWDVKDAYTDYDRIKNKDNEPSETLTTKILLGTFGCIPAFDRFFKKGLGQYQSQNGSKRSSYISEYKLTQTLEKNTDSFKALAAFAVENQSELKIQNYPLMKCVDTYFWEIGYEMDMAIALRSNDSSDEKKQSLLKQAIHMGLCNKSTINCQDAAQQILDKN